MATVITVTHDDGHRTARTVTAEELDTLTGTELAHRVLSHPTAADISAFETVINEFQGKRGVSPTEVEVTAAAVMARSRNLEDVSDDDVTDAELAEQELTADQERRLARQLIDDGLLPPSAAETQADRLARYATELESRYGVTGRDRSILRDVAAGRVAMTSGQQPALIVDGRNCCDQSAGRRLMEAGLIEPARSGAVGQWVPAVLTDAGLTALAGAR